MVLIFLLISPNVYSWYPLNGFPEIGYGIKGYPIEGNYSQYVEVSVFPYVKKYGIMFYNGGMVSSPDGVKITLDICGKIRYGITKSSQILFNKNVPSSCYSYSPLFLSVQSDKSNTTIYRFDNDH